MNRILAIIISAAVTFGFLGCTGGQKSITIVADTEIMGFVTSSSSAITWASQIVVGDNTVDFFSRGFLSFSTEELPAYATITSAVFRLYTDAVNGTPFFDLGPLIVDHVEYGDTLDADDMDTVPLHSSVGTLTKTDEGEYVELDVTQYLQGDIDNAKGRTQYRLKFQIDTDSDRTEDAVFYIRTLSGEKTPQLYVEYKP